MNELLKSPTYSADDITLLLKTSTKTPVSVQEKESLIASGGHYSDVFVKEKPMGSDLFAAYQYALIENRGAERLACHTQYLARKLMSMHTSSTVPLVLISLVRAGVPLGVLLTRCIKRHYPDIAIHHYGVSIIRGRGIDTKALSYIHKKHPFSKYYFVDGWTGKGAISHELKRSLEMLGMPFQYNLIVNSDPAGTATLSATREDWLIPFGLIGSQISGLFSRTLWKQDDFHEAALFSDLETDDIGMDFINKVESFDCNGSDCDHLLNDKDCAKESPSTAIKNLMITYNLNNIHKVKPGIAEATRAIHRRTPELIILRSAHHPDTYYLEKLAKDRGVPIEIKVEGGMGPFKAITILS